MSLLAHLQSIPDPRIDRTRRHDLQAILAIALCATLAGADNLTCVNCATAESRIQYAYDGDQKRTVVTKAGVKTYEFYGAHGNLLAEYTQGSPGKLVEYIYLNGKRIAQKESAQ